MPLLFASPNSELRACAVGIMTIPIELRSNRRPVVLVVDDEEPARAAYIRVLERASFETCEAETGVAALQQLRSRLVHAVVVDQHMPGMTGMDLTTQIRALPSYDRTPILFVSGDGSPTVRIRALQAGATDFMVKPVVLDELVARVEVQLRVNATWQSTVEVSRDERNPSPNWQTSAPTAIWRGRRLRCAKESRGLKATHQ